MSDQPSEEIRSYQMDGTSDLFPVDNTESISSISTNPFEIASTLASPRSSYQRVLPQFVDTAFRDNTAVPYLPLAENAKYAYQNKCTCLFIALPLGDNLFDSSDGSSAFLFEADDPMGFCDYYNRVKNPAAPGMSVQPRAYLRYPEETGSEIDYPVRRPVYRRQQMSRSLYNSYPGVAMSSNQPFGGDDFESAYFADRLDRVPAAYKARDPQEFFPGPSSLSSVDPASSFSAFAPVRRSMRSVNSPSRILLRRRSESQYDGVDRMDRMDRMDRVDRVNRVDQMDQLETVQRGNQRRKS